MFFALGGGGDDDVPEMLVHRLCKFAMKTINQDMSPLFEKFVPVFDQELVEMHHSGETHQQYAAYQEYLIVLEQHLVNFVAQEGYGGGDAAAFLSTLRQQVAEDAANVELRFKRTWESLKNELGDLSELGGDRDELMEQLREFYRPPTVDDLMQTVLNMTEYATFSRLMRSKVHRMKIIQEMKRRKEEMMSGEMGLAHRFIAFATRVLNIDLEPFYQKCLPLFEQDFSDQGNTHEQFAAFQEFVKLAEDHFNTFMAREGFPNDANGFIVELQRLAQKDKERLDAELKKTLAEVEQQHRSVSGDAGGDSAKPLILVCKPTSLADLINHFARYTEYEVFSNMMRSRIAEANLMKQLFQGLEDATRPAEDQQGDGYQKALPPAAPTAVQMSDGYASATSSTAVQLPLEQQEAGYPQISPPRPAQDAKLSVTVPEGCSSGSQLSVPTPDGQMLLATVPIGLMPGMTFEVSYQPASNAAPAPAQMLSVTVPDGCSGGSQLGVPTPDGQSLLATVPDGLSPGMVFQISYTPLR